MLNIKYQSHAEKNHTWCAILNINEIYFQSRAGGDSPSRPLSAILTIPALSWCNLSNNPLVTAAAELHTPCATITIIIIVIITNIIIVIIANIIFTGLVVHLAHKVRPPRRGHRARGLSAPLSLLFSTENGPDYMPCPRQLISWAAPLLLPNCQMQRGSAQRSVQKYKYLVSVSVCVQYVLCALGIGVIWSRN